jgi:hypothetical protein
LTRRPTAEETKLLETYKADVRILGEFIDWHIQHNELPADLDAAFKRWIRTSEVMPEPPLG